MAIKTTNDSGIFDLTYNGKPIRKVITGKSTIVHHPIIPEVFEPSKIRCDLWNEDMTYQIVPGTHEGVMSIYNTIEYSSVTPATRTINVTRVITKIEGDLRQGLPGNGNYGFNVGNLWELVYGTLSWNEAYDPSNPNSGQPTWQINGAWTGPREVQFSQSEWDKFYTPGTPAWDEEVIEERIIYSELNTYVWQEKPYLSTTTYIVNGSIEGGEFYKAIILYPPTKSFYGDTMKLTSPYFSLSGWKNIPNPNINPDDYITAYSGVNPPLSSYLTTPTGSLDSFGRVISIDYGTAYYVATKNKFYECVKI